jgi:phenylalanyl-tRNA synthetase alpha subunit
MVDSALKDITKLAVMPALPKTRAVMQPKPTPEGMIGAAELGPALSEISEAERQSSMRVGEADIAIEEAKRQEKAQEAELRSELVGRMATEARELPERKALTEARTEFGNMAFVPTKETTQDLAGIFSLMSIVGMVVGKGNAQLAMSSMNGMLEGYQKGRADLYKKELTQFDKNFKAMQSKVLTLEKELSEAMELKKLDREKGDLAITMALAKAESPLLNAMRNRLGDVAVSNGVQDTKKTLITLATMVNDLQGKANAREDADRIARENRLAADERARLSREQAKQLAELRASQPGRQGQHALTFASRVYGNIENAVNDLVNLTNLPAVAESPIFAGMIGADRATVLQNITAFAARKVTNQDQRAFEQIANSLDAALARLEAQGLANGSTRGAIASFSALKPREGDEAINMAIYLARVKQEIETGIKVHAEMPGATPGQKQNNVRNIERINKTVPFSVEDTLNVLKANRKPLGVKMEQLLNQPQIVPNTTMQPQDGQSQYQIGQVIKKGNKTYRITGLDDPNDPDIEEVK